MTDKRFQRKLERMKKRGERYKAEQEVRNTYAEYVPERKKRKFSNIMILIIIINIVAFVVASFWLQYKTGMFVDSTLTTCWFSFWTVEIAALTGIKISKVKNSSNDDVASG